MADLSKFAAKYTKLRTGRTFLWFLVLFCGFWVGWNKIPWLPKFDDSSFGRLTLILSIEASLATSILIMSNEKQVIAQQQQLLYIQHMMEAQKDTMQAILLCLRSEQSK